MAAKKKKIPKLYLPNRQCRQDSQHWLRLLENHLKVIWLVNTHRPQFTGLQSCQRSGILNRKCLKYLKKLNIPCPSDYIHTYLVIPWTFLWFYPFLFPHFPLSILLSKPYLIFFQPSFAVSISVFYIFLPFPFTSCLPSLYFPSFSVGSCASAQGWFELGLHLYVDAFYSALKYRVCTVLCITQRTHDPWCL